MPDVSALVGSTVTQVTMDEYQLTLLFFATASDGSIRVNARLAIEKSFAYEAVCESFEIDPQLCETFGPAWRFLKRKVLAADATADLVLNIAFDDGSRFTLQPGGPHEAFHLSGDGVPGLLAGPD